MRTMIEQDQTFQPLMNVYKTVTTIHRQKPIIVDADDLQENPGKASKHISGA